MRIKPEDIVKLTETDNVGLVAKVIRIKSDGCYKLEFTDGTEGDYLASEFEPFEPQVLYDWDTNSSEGTLTIHKNWGDLEEEGREWHKAITLRKGLAKEVEAALSNCRKTNESMDSVLSRYIDCIEEGEV